MKKLILLCSFIAVLGSLFNLHAQTPCGFDNRHNHLLETDSNYARRFIENSKSIQKYIAEHPGLRTPVAGRPFAVYTIPVVVHVMHTGDVIGSLYNPTDAQINGAIAYLNQVFAGTYPGMTTPSAGGAAGDLEIRFALAQRTPTCGSTNGIDRVDASSIPNYVANGVNSSNTNGASELAVKDFARWNTADYYNIWLVNKIDGKDGTSGQFTAGYAYFPSASASLDGTIMLASQMASGEKTLPHEIGHALNLYHTFQGSANSSQCPPNSTSPTCGSVGDGDECCDTDPVSNNNVGGVYNFSCRTGTANNCTASPGPTRLYTVNTESNFMAYTNCYTLFTNDQKARVQAAMSLPSRASLVSGTNMALTPCGSPAVNFNVSTGSGTETDPLITGCREYKDYNFQMVIGQATPSNAIATLSLSGSAVQGLDYDITTNNSFTTPSNIITFPANTTAAQPFTIRVYDDGNVEATENIIVNFTLDASGGGTKGTHAPTLTFTLFDNDVAPTGNATGTSAYSATNAGTISTQSCFRSSKIKHRTQYLLTKAELNTMGITSAANLNSLRFRIATKNSTKNYAGFTVSLANSTNTDMLTGFVTTGFTQVFTGSYASVTGDNNITFSTPFVWDGSSNVVVNICFENASADAGDDLMEANLASYFASVYANYTAGATSGCSLPATSVSSARPRMLFTYSIIPTPVETVASSVASMHIATGSNDYFYTNNNKLLLKLSGISVPLGCVTANLDSAGNTWINGYKGGMRSAKVIKVTPTLNTATANYTIDLYFDNAELDGKNAANLKIAKTTATTLTASNNSNTVIVNPSTITTLGTTTTVFTASFTGFSNFFLVDGSVTLPVELTSFEGSITTEQNALLQWSTSSEQNNKQFDVETSSDGTNFYLLGTIASKGNSASAQNYEYLHQAPSAGNNWYRLKQIDIDGKFSYSKIIVLNVPVKAGEPFVYPIPANNHLTLNMGSVTAKSKIEIYSADMKIVKKEHVPALSVKKELDISQLAPGVYFIRITTNGTDKTLRFIKQ